MHKIKKKMSDHDGKKNIFKKKINEDIFQFNHERRHKEIQK